MMSFTEFNNLMENDFSALDERVGRSNWVKAVAVGLQTRVNAIGNQITSTSEVSKKIDLLSSQLKWVAGLATLSVATDIRDKSIMKGIRK